MKTVINAIAEVFGFFFGAGGFWKIILSFEENKNIESKRYEFLFILRPLFAAFNFLILWLVVTQLPDIIESIFNISYISAIINFFETINKIINNIFKPIMPFFPYDPLFRIYAISLYIICYRAVKRKISKRLYMLGEHLFQKSILLENIIREIYVDIPGTKKAQLSIKWEHIKDNLERIIIFNFILFYVINVVTRGFATTFVWNFIPANIIPFIGFFSLMEIYHYLSFEDDFYSKYIPDTTLDLVKLRISHQKYAIDNGISMIHDYWRNDEILKETIQTIEENYIKLDNANMEFIYQYLAERDQLIHFDMTVRLAKGENIFYASPFYKDIDGCIFFLIFRSLMRQEKVLIISNDDGNLNELLQWIQENLESISGLKRLWNVAILQDYIIDVNVGILSFQNICSDQMMGGLEEYLKKVSFAVILEASDMLAGGQETIISLSEYITHKRTKCTWLLCDWNAESMLDLFSHLLSVNFIYVNATPIGAKEVVVSYWDLETEPDQIWSPAKRFLGIEAGIAEVAGKNKVPTILWYGKKWTPVIDMSWILGQYYQLYGNKIAQSVNQSKMDTQIQCSLSGNSCSIVSESFIVIEDSCCNLYEVSSQYTTLQLLSSTTTAKNLLF